MKYIRFEFEDNEFAKLNRYFIKMIIPFIILVVSAGLLLSKLIIIPAMSGSSAIDDKSTIKYMKVKPKKFYTLQMGAFESEQNVKLFADRLRKKGIPSFINMKMKYYHVTTCADENKAWVTKRLQYYKSLGYNSIIKDMSINVKDLPKALKNDQKCALLYSLLKVTGDSISINQDALRDYESKKTDDRILKSKLYASYSNIAKIYNEYKKSSTSLDFKEIDKKVNDQISLFSEISKNGGVVDKINIDEKMMQIIYYYRDIADKANSLI